MAISPAPMAAIVGAWMPELAAPALRAPNGYVSLTARSLLGDLDLGVARLPLADLLALVRVSTEQALSLVRLAPARLGAASVLLRTAEAPEARPKQFGVL
jgi:hypothetical protein